MLRLFIGIALASTVALAQDAARPSVDEQLTNVSQLLKSGRTSEAERILRHLTPKLDEAPVPDSGIFTHAEVHDILWSMVGYSYLGANDYAGAERVAAERLGAAEARGDAAKGRVPTCSARVC